MERSAVLSENRLQIDGYKWRKGYTWTVTRNNRFFVKFNRTKPYCRKDYSQKATELQFYK